MRPAPAAAVLGLALLLPSALSAAEDPVPPLKVNPFKKGLDGWERTGSDKAFAWNAGESTLTVKGQGGKEPPRLVCTKYLWDGGGIRFQAKKGARKVRVVLLTEPKGPPVSVEFPKDAVKGTAWTDLGVVLRGGKAVLLAPGADGAEAEVGSAAVPAGASVRFGLEAPSGTDAILTGVVLQREYADAPQVAEEGFESVFDGKSLGAWCTYRPEFDPMFTVADGLLSGQVRTEDIGGLYYTGRFYRSYELRMRALWGTTQLKVRPVEAHGPDGSLNNLDTVEVNLGDNVDPENVNDVVIRVADGMCAVTVNGKKVFESKVKSPAPTPVGFFLDRGKKFLLRDIRIKDLAPGEGSDPGDAPKGPEKPAPEERPAAPWTPKGGFKEDAGGWTVADPEEIAGLLCPEQGVGSYELRFKVARGAVGLSVIPRASRGVDRSSGIRLGEALFTSADWTEVVLRMDLLKATVTVGGAAAGTLEVDSAGGAPGIRVAMAGKATIKDIVFTPAKR